MSNRDVEFAEFFSVAWPRVFRTTYAVAGHQELARDAVQAAFARTYADWSRVLDSGEPESEVCMAAIHDVLSTLRKDPVPDSSGQPVEFGPLVPQGSLISASAEERSRVDALWAELRALEPQQRAGIAVAAYPGDLIEADLGRVPPAGQDRQHLVDFLAANLDEVRILSGDLEEATKQGSARRRRRRWIIGAVAAVLVAVVAIPAALFAPRDEAVSAKNVGAWREVASSPLSPRWSSVAMWTGSEALFIGGNTDESCTARTICHGVRDGAAYNPASNTWRRIADAPFDVSWGWSAQIGDQTFLQSEEGWWVYDASDDEWSQIPDPPGVKNVGSVTGANGTLYVVGFGAKGPIRAYDAVTKAWSTVPPSPFQPGLMGRFLVGTPEGLMVMGVEPSDEPESPEDGSVFIAESFDGDAWTRLEPSGQKAFLCCWIWTGERLVHLERLPVYGGEDQTKGVRFAGGMTLDTGNGEWGYLAESPQDAQGTDTWRLYAWNDADHPSPLAAVNGYVYDDRDMSWARLSRPVQAPEAETAAVWADGRLIAFGGANFGAGEDENTGSTNRTWVYTPRAP